MKTLAALLLLLYTGTAVPEESGVQWWEAGVLGACTRTDVEELGGCFKLEVKTKPTWE